jgi:hypothetical protein
LVGYDRLARVCTPRESRHCATGLSELVDGHIPSPIGLPWNPSRPERRNMPRRVAVICKQTAQEPTLCSCNCGHILRCLILWSIRDFGGPADESQSAPLEGNSALQLDDARWTFHKSRATPGTECKLPVDPDWGGRSCRTTILNLVCDSVVKALVVPLLVHRWLPLQAAGRREDTTKTDFFRFGRCTMCANLFTNARIPFCEWLVEEWIPAFAGMTEGKREGRTP